MPSRGTKWTANSMIAGAGGGFVASVATCPLDVVKTKLQAQRIAYGHTGYLGVTETVRSIILHDGLRGMYRGLGPTILGYLPTWAIYFSVYDGIKTRFGDAPLASTHTQDRDNERLYPAPSAKGYQPVIREHPWSLHILSAMCAGATSTICTNPLWVIKTRFMVRIYLGFFLVSLGIGSNLIFPRLQTQSRDEVRYRHTLDAAITIFRTEGISAFYRGLIPSLLGITHVAVQFPLYEQLKLIAQRHNPNGPLPSHTILLCSALAKMTASVTTYPHEVVRTRMQTLRLPIIQNDERTIRGRVGIVRTVRKIITREGWRGLYKGLSINLIRTVPNSAVTMLTYELLMRQLSARDPRH
ncbi:hypothetical protein EW146_g9031 [Bondarzewia mesenterica]|uniref:Uncharacterized protein n=1 Tax=Bondarzewia mesenterica TaxID=1095465 RepID=A0A4S4L9I4_9AGAM|nr:hypothetical protein EW146_g9031 [Bondarzewia mesenterica]